MLEKEEVSSILRNVHVRLWGVIFGRFSEDVQLGPALFCSSRKGAYSHVSSKHALDALIIPVSLRPHNFAPTEKLTTENQRPALRQQQSP
jgi:hypothetical protein